MSASTASGAALDAQAANEPFERYRQAAISLLTDAKVKNAFDVVDAEPKVLDRYGRHAFGWSLLMARRLVEAGVNLVQVNLGNNETWDTHGNMFPHLKEKLFPPTDQALSALLDDLHESGLLDSTLIVMAGEFGRTPRISTLPQHLQAPRPRPLGQGPDGFPRGRRRRRRPGRRLVRQDRRLPAFRPPDSREPGRHDLSRARFAGDRRVARCAGPAAFRLSWRADRRLVLNRWRSEIT